MNQRGVATGLKIFTIFIGLIGILFFFWYMPILIEEVSITENLQQMRWPGTIGMWLIAAMCYLSLGCFWGICTRIHKNRSFSIENARAMKRIGLYMIGIILLVIGGLIYLGCANLLAGPLLIATFFVLSAISGIAVLCFALSKLIENAAAIQEENELTI